MSGFENDPLREAGLRHELTLEEKARVRAYILAHPELEAEMEFDLKLNELLRQLPDKPLATNFTAQVLEAVQREQKPALPSRFWRLCFGHLTGRWLPRAALAMLVLVFGLFSYHHQVNARADMARTVAVMSTITKLVSVDNLQDFEAINRFSQARVEVDEELLAALK